MRRLAALAAMLGFAVCASAASFSNGVQVIPNEAHRRVDITIDGAPFTSYIWPTSLKKPVLFPLITDQGITVTRGYPLDPRPNERVDHPHHAGLWFNYGNVNGFDFWNNSDAIKPEARSKMGTILHTRIVSTKSGADRGELVVESVWFTGEDKPILNQTTRYIFARRDHARAIDQVVTLKALDHAVFNDDKEGLLGMRVARWLESPEEKGGVFMDASGNPTKVDSTPDDSSTPVTGVYLTSENVQGPSAWSTRGRWCILTGNTGGQTVTIAIIDHPKNPNYPTYWHARGYGLFAANPLGQHIFDPKAAELDFTLDKGKTATFRYRVLLINGKPSSGDMNGEADRFAAEYLTDEVSAGSTTAGQADYFSNWPVGVSPQEVGKRVAEHFVTSPHQYTATIHYSEAATWYGALTFAQLTHDDALRTKLIQKFEPLMPEGAEASRIPTRHHVDDSIFGIVPLEIGLQTKDARYLDDGKAWADRQWENPQPDGLSAETRYWIDDMYMLTILQLEAFRATNDRKYLDRDAQEMVAYLAKLQQPDGLFYHAPDVPFFWGRGDGWVAAGMAEMLRDLPADHPQRSIILNAYRAMMAALLKYQGRDGMWRQLIDQDEAWPESSSSAMFSFAMITGVKNGWLDADTYGPAARKGWIAVAGYVDQNYDVTSVCEGTGKKNDRQYYLDRKRRTGDFHGQAPILWSASALLR
jgi:rhamnogalacturonyl hydrolase YesR